MADRRRKSSAAAAPGRKNSLAHGLAYQENIKEKQQRYKEARDERQARITPAIKWIIKCASSYFQREEVTTTNFILDSEEQLELLENFIVKGGRRTVMFFHQEGDIPKMESGRSWPRTNENNGKCMKIIVTDGRKLPLTGQCYLFAKNKNDLTLTARNVSDETLQSALDPTKYGGSLLLAVRKMLEAVFVPALNQYDDWRKLNSSKEGKAQISKFKTKLEHTAHYLKSADKNTKNIILLAEGPDDDLLASIKGPAKQKEVAAKSDKVKILENLAIDVWCKQMNQVLSESDQMRKEADDTGPIAELDHWRNLLVASFGLDRIIFKNRLYSSAGRASD